MNPIDAVLNPEEQSAFLQSSENVRQTAEWQFRTHQDETSVIAFVRNLQQGVDRVVDLAVHAGTRVDCKAGCCHCCSAKVEAIAPEIFEISRELAKRSAEELAVIVARLREYVVAQNVDSARWNQRKSCPFLTSDLCSIYTVRPTTCRKAHSMNVGECAAYKPTIPQDLGIALNSEALLRGTRIAYGQRGFDASNHELVRAVLIALHDPTARARWYRGEQVFETAAQRPTRPGDGLQSSA
jgi:Fe-S-cluster containining protein